MTLSNTEEPYISTLEAAALVGVSAPTLLRVAGIKVGLDGTVFPQPVQVSKKKFVWERKLLEAWVSINGVAPPSNRGRPKGSTKNRNLSAQETYIYNDITGSQDINQHLAY